MEENEVLEETTEMDDIVETEADILDDTVEEDTGFDPVVIGIGGVATVALIAFTQRKRIAKWVDKQIEKSYKKWCEKTGRSYVVIVNDEENEEKSEENNK